MAEQTGLVIRKMEPGDVPSVYDIEQKAFPSGSWTLDAFYHELEKNEFAHYFVLVLDGVVIGYLGMWIVVDQAQITTVAVNEQFRGFGYGKLLLEYVINYARITCEMMSLEVRVENNAARGLYESLGFTYGGIRRDYYGPGEDAKVMWVKLR